MKTKLNTPFFIFHAAKDFFEKGTQAASENFKRTASEQKQFDSLIHAKLCMPIVNIVFSVELVFKGILKQLGTTNPRTHNLVKLFNLLTPEIQDKIVLHYQSHDAFKNYISIRIINRDGLEHGSSTLLPRKAKTKSTLIEMLESNKMHFEEFRYLFDYDGDKEIWFHFREFSNFSFSCLTVLGELIGLKVVAKRRLSAAK